jgi:hypothetical protein
MFYLWASGLSIGMIHWSSISPWFLAAQAVALGLLGYWKVSRD